ncbi:MAG: ABC transporter substrate-binding protein [Deltaproteobacteria bacterium]|nr:ABC transporter substrate-binding protein [Deltaproteobacteria bacterium]MBW2049273.1 ABC transporter substrate-binding protein [Deltaproteobacteria bacterium]MBW2355020.1 ABC transporter substrate-binding protein [Deltaproteobacteria bacterium]
MKKGKTLGLIVLFVFMISISMGFTADAKEFKFGQILAMTGSGSWYGMTMERGTSIAIDEINKAGGVKGYQFGYAVEDHKSGLTTPAQNAFRKLTSIDKVSAILSSFSAPTLSIMAMAKQKKTIVFNGGASSPKLINIPYLHNTRMLGNEIAPFTLKYLWDKGYRTMATIYANQTAPISLNDTAKKYWKKLGGKVVSEQMHETGATDFTSEASIIKAKNPDIIFCPSTGLDVGYVIKAVRKMRIKAPICGTEHSGDMEKVTGRASEGYLFASEFFDVNSDDPWTKAFVTAFKKKFNEDADFYAANYYELTYILKDLVSRVVAKGGNPYDGSQLEKAIWDNPKFKSIYGGYIKFKKNGTCEKPVVLFEIQDGKPVIIKKRSK